MLAILAVILVAALLQGAVGFGFGNGRFERGALIVAQPFLPGDLVF